MHRILLAALLCSATTAEAARQLTLHDAVELAMKTDPTLSEARIARDRAKWTTLRAQLDRVSLKIDGSIQELYTVSNIGGPQLFDCNIGGSAGVTFQSSPMQCTTMGGTSSLSAQQQPTQGVGTFNVQAQLNVPIFAGFRVQSNVDRAKRLEDASLAGIQQARKDLALTVMRAYWQVRRLELLIEVQKQSLERLLESEQVTDGRVKAGLAPPIDFNRARLRRAQTAASIADLQGQAKEARAQLGFALGIDDDVILVDNPVIPETAPPPVTELLAEAHQDRPELKSARYQALAAHQAVRMAMSNFYPQLSGFGLFQFTNNAFNFVTGARSTTDEVNPFAGISGNLTVGLQLSMNFFDTFNTYTSMKDARFEEYRLLEEARRYGRVVDNDVKQAYAKVWHLYDRRGPLLAAQAIARDNAQILEARYKNGDALVIEYLDGQNDLLNAEQQVVDLDAQLQQAWYELEGSLGRVVGVNL